MEDVGKTRRLPNEKYKMAFTILPGVSVYLGTHKCKWIGHKHSLKVHKVSESMWEKERASDKFGKRRTKSCTKTF